MPASEDPIRDEVERVLHNVVGTAIALPLAAVNGVQRCVGRRVGQLRRRLTEPASFVRSLFDIVATPRPGVVTAGQPAAPMPAVAPQHPRPAPRQASETLPIEEYQSLAASQVVARLPALTAVELAAVRRFEAAHRGRRTVLGRIDQLLVSS